MEYLKTSGAEPKETQPAAPQIVRPLYKDSTASIDARVEDLLSRMTIQEKADQICQSVARDYNPNNVQAADSSAISPTYGSYINAWDLSIRNAVQKLAVGQSRLGIPALFGADVIHGCFLTFPIPLAQACSWNPDLVRRSCGFAAAEARRVGIDWTFSPMVDIALDPRWGRIAEGYGESPYAASIFGAAAVQGYQGESLNSQDTVASCLKHFVAYGASEGGRDYAYTDVSSNRLWNLYLPPFQAGVAAGAVTCMSSFNDLNGTPLTANYELLTEVLREQWAFQGLLVTDWGAVDQLVTQGRASDGLEAIKLSVNAGIDMDMLSYHASKHLAKLVCGGEVAEERINEAVRRILQLKFSLGLFEHPYTSPGNKLSSARITEGEAVAAELATQSLVLLKNEENTLPIARQARRIALIGPLATEKAAVMGSWIFAGKSDRTVSIEEGLRAELPSEVILKTERGCDFDHDDRSGFAAALCLAADSDLVVLCLGETAPMSGENASRASIQLPGVQEDLALAIAKLGKPVVLVLSSGRPVDLQRLEPEMKAILAVWQPGTKTGEAVANVLLGRCNPSGRLAVTWPRGSGQIPIYHNMHRRARGDGIKGAYQDMPTSPLYEFGHGLSYTTFRYSPISLNATRVSPGGELVAEITVENTGKVDGAETVFWFINDPVASITQPLKELKSFEKALIPAGGNRVFRFAIKPEQDLIFRDARGYPILEPGIIHLMAGGQTTSFHMDI